MAQTENLSAIFQQYRRIRQQHPSITAKHAYHEVKIQARQQDRPPLEWQEPKRASEIIRFARLDHKGDEHTFQVRVSVHYDYDHDWCDSRGTFTNDWQEGAILVPDARFDRNKYRYFVPATSEEYHRSWFEQNGYSRAVAAEMARAYVLEDMQICCDPDKAGYVALGVSVDAFFRGVELGTSSCWGIEVKSSRDPYIEDVAWEEIVSAVHEAEKQLLVLRQP